jgi:poly(A) polymerase
MAFSAPPSDIGDVQETFGVTDPLSVVCATARDEDETRQMLAFLDSVYPAESPEGWYRRWGVLAELELKVSDWLITACDITPPVSSGAKNYVPSKVLTFGSFRLGIITPTSDIDTLILIPQSVSRDRFYNEFVNGILGTLPDVTECLLVTDARVPVAKVKYRGIYLDILVACVPPTSIVSDMETPEDSLIFQVDEKCMKSMNGIRVADKILRLVPDPAVFRAATRMIKYWAQVRCIYNNSVGYFGGVSWTMAVARTCQFYPNMSAKQIVERFFYTFCNWPWEEHRPITLCSPVEMKIPPQLIRQVGTSVFAQFRDWNPQKFPSDRYQIMPVITPIFPSHNTTYNVTETHKTVILDELKRGKEIIQLMSLSGGEIGWRELCAPCPFFDLFEQFLELRVSAVDQVMLGKFKGLVESRIRSLIRVIENWAKRPHANFFPTPNSTPPSTLAYGGSFFIGLSTTEPVNLAEPIKQFINDTMEKALESPEWHEIPHDSIRLEISVTDLPFPKGVCPVE